MPVQSAHDRRDSLLIDAGQNQRRFALQRVELLLQIAKLAPGVFRVRPSVSGLAADSASSVCTATCFAMSSAALFQLAFGAFDFAGGPRSWARMSRIFSTSCFSSFQRDSNSLSRAFSVGQLLLCGRFARSAVLMPTAFSPPMISSSVSSDWIVRRQSSTSAGTAMLTDRDAGRCRIEQADRFIGQLPRRNVAMRQPHGGLQGLVQKLHAMMFFQRRRHAPHHEDGFFFARLVNLNDLESAGEGRVFFDMLFVFGPSRGGDRAELAAGERRLQQIGRVARAGSSAGADERVGFVDEQDRWLFATPALLR